MSDSHYRYQRPLDIRRFDRMVLKKVTANKATFARTALGLLVLASAPFLQAQQSITPASPQPLVIVVHIDAMPPFTDQAVALLKQYRHESLGDPGAELVDILQQVGRPNHFTVVEEWDNQADYDKHVAATHTIQFRQQLSPMPGAPFDERSHSLIN